MYCCRYLGFEPHEALPQLCLPPPPDVWGVPGPRGELDDELREVGDAAERVLQGTRGEHVQKAIAAHRSTRPDRPRAPEAQTDDAQRGMCLCPGEGGGDPWVENRAVVRAAERIAVEILRLDYEDQCLERREKRYVTKQPIQT